MNPGFSDFVVKQIVNQTGPLAMCHVSVNLYGFNVKHVV